MYGKPLFQDCQISLALRRHNKSSPGISTDKKGRKEEDKYWRRRRVFNITDPLRLSHTRISPEFMGENIGLRVFSHGFLCKVRCCFELKKRYDNPWWIYKDFFMFRFWSFWHPRLWNEMLRQLFVLKFEMLKRTVPRKKGDSLSLSNWMLRQLPRISPANCSVVGAEGSILRTKTGYFSCPLPPFLYKRDAKDISFPSNPKITRTKTRFGKKKPPLLSTCLL